MTDTEGEMAPILYPVGGILAWTPAARPGAKAGRARLPVCPAGTRQGRLGGCPGHRKQLLHVPPWASCPHPE